jgi:hypothetical protein
MLSPWINEMGHHASHESNAIADNFVEKNGIFTQLWNGGISLPMDVGGIAPCRVIAIYLTLYTLDLSLNPPEGVTVEDASTFKR